MCGHHGMDVWLVARKFTPLSVPSRTLSIRRLMSDASTRRQSWILIVDVLVSSSSNASFLIVTLSSVLVSRTYGPNAKLGLVPCIGAEKDSKGPALCAFAFAMKSMVHCSGHQFHLDQQGMAVSPDCCCHPQLHLICKVPVER